MSNDILDLLIRTAAGVAFPAAIAVYLLTRMETAINRVTDAISSLQRSVDASYRRRHDDDRDPPLQT